MRSCPSPPDRGPGSASARLPRGREHRRPQHIWGAGSAAPYLNAQSGSRASRPGAPTPFLLLKSFWNSVGAMLATAGWGRSLERLLGPRSYSRPATPMGASVI